MANRIDGGLYVSGGLSCDSFTAPASSVAATAVQSNAQIEAGKLQHQLPCVWGQSGTAVAGTFPFYLQRGPNLSGQAYGGIVKEVWAGSIVACTGNATITVDVKKNGTSILSSTIVLDNANTARTAEQGTINTALQTMTQGNLLEIVVTVAAGTGVLGTGLFVAIVLDTTAVQ